jgi:hypothetical protein
MIEECRSFLYNKEDYILQYVVLSNDVGLSAFLCLFLEVQGSMHWDCEFDITDAVVF